MQDQKRTIRKGLIHAVAIALVALFVIPSGALIFIDHAESVRSQANFERSLLAIERNPSLSPEARARAVARVQKDSFKFLCGTENPAFAELRLDACSGWSLYRQFHIGRQVALASGLLSVAATFSIILLSALAFKFSQFQYRSFVAAWHVLRLTTSMQVLLQGALLIWICYWIPRQLWEINPGRVVAIIAVVVFGVVARMLHAIFSKPSIDWGIDGELILDSDAPALWTHLRENCARLGITPPKQVIAGVDANFFVTESPLQVRDTLFTGRSLYVSLPLLRILNRPEADAVLAHELAHFRGGDAAKSAALAPKLVDFDHYSRLMWQRASTRPISYVLNVFRFIFELALRSENRNREFSADRVAANATSPHAIVSALLKSAAYSSYRSQIEEQLFERAEPHGATVGIDEKVAAGMNVYAASAQFLESMKVANVPHPFDSHPPLVDRMRNVGIFVEEVHYGAIVSRSPKTTWISDIVDAASLEKKLWSKHEHQFTSNHELSLAYRFEPANEMEREIVLKQFPLVEFALSGGKQVVITFEGVKPPNVDEQIHWSQVLDMEYHTGFRGDVLIVVHRERRFLRQRKTKIRLRGVAARRAEIKEALGRYWHRHNCMREYQASNVSTVSSPTGAES